MKHLKNFEEKTYYMGELLKEFEVGDYVETYYWFNIKTNNILSHCFKVIYKKPYYNHSGELRHMYNLEDFKGDTIWLNDNDISGKTTKEKFENSDKKWYIKQKAKKGAKEQRKELRADVKKYNL